MSTLSNATDSCTPVVLLDISTVTQPEKFKEIFPVVDRVFDSQKGVCKHRRMKVDWDSSVRACPDPPMSIALTQFRDKNAHDTIHAALGKDSTVIAYNETIEPNDTFLLVPDDPVHTPHLPIDRIAPLPGQVMEFVLHDVTQYGDGKAYKALLDKVLHMLAKDEYKFAFVGSSVWSAVNKPGVNVVLLVYSSVDAYKELLPVGKKMQEDDLALLRLFAMSYPVAGGGFFSSDVNHTSETKENNMSCLLEF